MKFRHVLILSLSLMMLLCSLTATACEYCWFWHYPGYFPTAPTEATSPTDPTDPTAPTEISTDYERIVTEDTVIFVTDSGIVEVPVTELWVQQNERLEELMKVYNENFNN